MIVVFHNRIKIVKIIGTNIDLVAISKGNIAEGIQQLAHFCPDEMIIWCHSELEAELNVAMIESVFHHNKLMLTYAVNKVPYLGNAIGYVEESPFIKVNKTVTYPSWLMSSEVGVIHASVLLLVRNKIKLDSNFDYYLNSVAKICMNLGLLCYSEPKLLKDKEIGNASPFSYYTLFRFVKQHYRTRWVFLLFLNLLIYEKRFVFLPFLISFCFMKRRPSFSLEGVKVESSRVVAHEPTIDVIIPTIGRMYYLYDVLKDLSKQTLLPQKVVIVEQNPVEGAVTELDYLKSEFWPFEIKHIFSHQAGACHARNLALDEVESEWVFLADDDNRFEKTLVSEVLSKMRQYGIFVATTSYIQKDEFKIYFKVMQWSTFGAGNSFVKRELVEKARFNTNLEFGYGEDVDFGMQLRNLGYDILYFPEPQILHLKAPIGGFRTKPILTWHNEVIQPKPSPTVMLSHLMHKTKEQLLGYKTILFFKYYKDQKIKSPIRYWVNFRKQWNQSVFWANQLNQKT